MGACLSSGSDYSRPCATVISISGELRRYPLPITASQVMQFEASSPETVFICNSDRLYFDDFIPSLAAEDVLESDQIYFLLPISRLQQRLAASDMAALAVKASVALNEFNPRRSSKARISPVLVAEEDPQSVHQIKINGNSDIGSKRTRKASAGVSRSSSVKKLHRNSSRRAKLAVRSFRIRLTTINEGSILVN